MLNNCNINQNRTNHIHGNRHNKHIEHYWKWSKTHLHALSLNIIERCKTSLKPYENLNVNLKIKNMRKYKQGIPKNCNASTLEQHFLNLMGGEQINMWNHNKTNKKHANLNPTSKGTC